MSERGVIVAIGPRKEIIWLLSVGIEVAPVETEAELAGELASQCRREEVRLVLLSESVAEGARELVSDMRERTGTVIMLVPSWRGSKGITLDWIRHAMEQSIGVDLISDE